MREETNDRRPEKNQKVCKRSGAKTEGSFENESQDQCGSGHGYPCRMEAGWSVDKILEDLGSPKEVADRFNAELGAERKPGGFRYIFLVLGAAAAVYAVYILAMNLYMKSMVQRQFRESVSLIGGADGPTSIFVSYTVGMIGNWMMSGGFVLACLDMYRFLGSRKTNSLLLSIISAGLTAAGTVSWIYNNGEIFRYWEFTWEFHFPALSCC